MRYQINTYDRFTGNRRWGITCFLASLVFVVTCNALPISAGEYNSVLSVGDGAPTWKPLPAADGKTYGSEDLVDSQATVVAFICNSCPYAVDAEDRLIELCKRLADCDVACVAVNVNKIDEDSLDAMKAKASAKSFPFPYLYDETQQIAKDFGAKYTPEFFVLDDQRKVVYMGSFDDSPDGRNVTTKYVEDAVQATLAGAQPQVQETVPIGCRIRMDRQRRRKSRRTDD